MSNGKVPSVSPTLAHLEHVPFDSLLPFQGDLKQLTTREYAKLRKSLLDNGIIVPFFVWIDDGGKCWLEDGHQRHRVFTGEGWQRLDVPIIRIEAANQVEAKQKLLVISSQYGKVTQDGWDSFTRDLPQDWLTQTVHFDALPFVFGELPPPERDNTPPDEFAAYDDDIDTQYCCPKCGYEWSGKPR